MAQLYITCVNSDMHVVDVLKLLVLVRVELYR